MVILVVRPLLHFGHEAIVNQAIVPQTTNMIRWRTHAYTLGHSLNYFQSDFAGRLANRIIQVGPALPRGGGRGHRPALVRRDLRLHGARRVLGDEPLARAADARLDRRLRARSSAYFVPRAQDRSRVNAEKRSILVGRIVDSYTNILTVKLFARGAEERSAVREAIAAHTRAFSTRCA